MDVVRAPRDKLFTGCVIGASLAYVAFLVAMQLAPPGEESGQPPRQGFVGMVSNESRAHAKDGGDPEGAEGVVEVGVARTYAYIFGTGGKARPVVLVDRGEAGAPARDPAGPRDQPAAGHEHASTGQPGAPPRAPISAPSTWIVVGAGGPGSLVVDQLVLAGLEHAWARATSPRDAPPD